MSRLFGTDGVRGVANDELTPLLAMQLGQAGAYVLTKENEHRPTIMVGCDTRISGDMLANALMAGICSVGANAVYVGVIPTPAVAYLTRKYKVDAGAVSYTHLDVYKRQMYRDRSFRMVKSQPRFRLRMLKIIII